MGSAVVREASNSRQTVNRPEVTRAVALRFREEMLSVRKKARRHGTNPCHCNVCVTILLGLSSAWEEIFAEPAPDQTEGPRIAD